jgi:hypothetical protein
MLIKRTRIERFVQVGSILLLFTMLGGCSRKPEPAGVKKLQPGAEFAGFLSNYSNLKPNPAFENTRSYVKQDDAKNIHKYFAVIIEPVEIYVSTNTDPSKLPDRGRTAIVAYFQHAITRAISDAFPVVQDPGPLVLRLRTALIGVDVSGDTASGGKAVGDALERAVDIGKVGVEMEMVDSVTGEQIAAAIDRQDLGAGAVVGSEAFSRDEKFAAAKEAFDGWATRLRDFLDSAHELSKEDVDRADASYLPYGEPPAARKK